MKRCSECMASLPTERFSKNRRQLDGLHTQCKECNAAYYRKNKARIQAYRAELYARNADENRAYSRRWYENNKGRALASCKAWAQQNQDAVRQIKAAWNRRNPDKKAAGCQVYRTRKIGAMPPWLSESDIACINGFYAMADRVSRCLGVKHHVDHIYPLRGKESCGLHVPWNLRVIPAALNLRKGNKMLTVQA